MPTFTESATLCSLWKTRLLGDLLNRLFQFGIFGILCYPVVQRTVPDTMICSAAFNVSHNRYWDINVLYLNNKKAFQWDAYCSLFDCSGGVWVQGVYTIPWSHTPLVTPPDHTLQSHPGHTWDTHPPAPLHVGMRPSPWTDRHLWRHYLPATRVAGGIQFWNSNCVKGEFTHTTSLKTNLAELWRFSL